VPVAGLKSCITLNIKVHGNMTCKNKQIICNDNTFYQFKKIVT